MNWKQPIDTNLIELCKGDKFATTVFEKLLLRTSNSDKTYYINSEPIFLKRGQCFCGRFELGEWFGLSRGQSIKIQRILARIEKVYHLMNKQKTRNGSIITIHNYDKLVEFEQSNEQSMNNQRTIKEQSTNTNKNVKSEKNDNNDPCVGSADEGQNQIIPNLLNDKKKHIQIIGLYARAKNINFTNKEHQKSFILRNVKESSKLVCYDINRIIEVLQWLIQNADFKWTLETVGKYIDEDLTKIKRKPKTLIAI